jgi:beta-glucuronidase
VCNESATGTPGGIAYFRAMRDFVRQLDPERYVSYADDKLPTLQRAEDSAANDADFLMMNQYFGSWHGPRDALGESLDEVHRMFPNKMVIISEFGFAGLFAKRPEDADPMRVQIIEEQMPELAKRDWIAGAILWCYQDYRSRRNLRPGLQEGVVEHGVVDEYRQRKPSYYVWKELNAPATLSVQTGQGSSNSVQTFTITVRPNAITRLPSYPLHGYSVDWELHTEEGGLETSGSKQLGDLDGEKVITASFPNGSNKHLFLHVQLVKPDGFMAAEKTVPLDAVEAQKKAGDSHRVSQAPAN